MSRLLLFCSQGIRTKGPMFVRLAPSQLFYQVEKYNWVVYSRMFTKLVQITKVFLNVILIESIGTIEYTYLFSWSRGWFEVYLKV